MSRPSITIAIPSYNKEAQIERCIESALKNADLVEKIIVIDNCSTDQTFSLAKKYEPKITCVQNDTNLGMSGNFNRCIELCETDWLLILHADDEILPDIIKKYRGLIEKYQKLGLIHGDSYSMIESDIGTKTYHPRNAREFYTAGTDALSCPYGVCSAVMVKKEAYDKLGLFISSSLSSDVEMWARVASRYDVGSINEPTVIYHISNTSTGPQSLVNRSIKEIKADWDNLTARMTSYYPEGPARDAYLKKVRIDEPGNYFAIVKANLRAGNWRNVFDGLKLIIIYKKDLWPLTKIVVAIFFRRLSSIFKI